MGTSATHWACRMTCDNGGDDLEVLEDDGEVLRSLDLERGRVSASWALTLVDGVRRTFHCAQKDQAFSEVHMTTEMLKGRTAPEMLIDKRAGYFSFLNIFRSIYPTSFLDLLPNGSSVVGDPPGQVRVSHPELLFLLLFLSKGKQKSYFLLTIA